MRKNTLILVHLKQIFNISYFVGTLETKKSPRIFTGRDFLVPQDKGTNVPWDKETDVPLMSRDKGTIVKSSKLCHGTGRNGILQEEILPEMVG